MTDHLEESGVRHWTGLLARIRFGTQVVNGRRISSAAIKSVANRLAAYADYRTGERVRPGLARIAVDLEIDHKTAKAAVAVLRRVGLLRLVAAGGRSGNADLYQLVIPADLLDRDDIEFLTVAAYDLEIERARTKSRNHAPRKTGPTGARQQPVDNPESQAPGGPAQPVEPPDLTGPVCPRDEPLTGPVCPPSRAPQGPATTQGPTTREISQPVADAPPAVTAPRARDATNKAEPSPSSKPPSPPGRCDRHPAFPAGVDSRGRLRCPPCQAQGRTPEPDRPALRLVPGGAA